MTLHNVAIGLIYLLVIIGFVLFGIGMYEGRYINKKSIRLTVQYSVLGCVAIGAAAWLITLLEGGFSWQALVLCIGMIIVSSLLALFNWYLAKRRLE